jgi:hypothetical protein
MVIGPVCLIRKLDEIVVSDLGVLHDAATFARERRGGSTG